MIILFDEFYIHNFSVFDLTELPILINLRHFVFRSWFSHRWHGLKRGPQIGNILIGEVGIKRIGEGRIVRLPLGRDPLPHCLVKLFDRPIANTKGRISG